MQINKDLIIEGTNKSLNTLDNEVNGLQGKVLWTNPNRTSTFNAQTITFSSGDYDYLEWYYLYNNASSQKVLKCEKSPKGYSPQLELIYGNGTLRRICDYVNDTTYSIRDVVGAGGDYIIPKTCY